MPHICSRNFTRRDRSGRDAACLCWCRRRRDCWMLCVLGVAVVWINRSGGSSSAVHRWCYLPICSRSWTARRLAGPLLAYGGTYIVASLAWLWGVEGLRPDRWDVTGAVICRAGRLSSSQGRASWSLARRSSQHTGFGVARSSRITHAPAGPPAHCVVHSSTNVFRLFSSACSSFSLRRTSARRCAARSRAAVQSRPGEPTSATSSRICSIGNPKSRQRRIR